MSSAVSSQERHGAASFTFSDAEFNRIASFARINFGLHLPLPKKQLVYGRLSRRIRARRLSGFAEYLDLLEAGTDQQERREMLSALTTNVTHFFRELHHFDLLKSKVIPPLVERARNGRRVRLWSAGCSSGPEPYSMAMSFLEQCPEADRLDVKIFATDIDPNVLRVARNGVYSVDAIDPVPVSMQKLYFAPANEVPDHMRVSEKVKSLVSFSELNLIEPLSFAVHFDVIFCRNVVIYFDKTVQALVWSQIENVLAEEGCLCVGHSERISGPAQLRFQSIGATSYRKTTSNGDRKN